MPHVTPLVIGCHHKTGSNLLAQLLNAIEPMLIKRSLARNRIIGSHIDRKVPLSAILKHYNGCDCYINCWFEHEIDVPSCSIKLLHFIRNPIRWVRSAYLYHKGGALLDLVRWVEWRVFKLRETWVSYRELLNGLDCKQGLAVEAIRSFPEICGTARVVRTGASLNNRLNVSLEEFRCDFESATLRTCIFIGLLEPDIEASFRSLKDLDLSHRTGNGLPRNITWTAPETAGIERILAGDNLFLKLYSNATIDMGFQSSDQPLRKDSIFPNGIVEELLEGEPLLSKSWNIGEVEAGFMRKGRSLDWWTAYAQQVPACGHLMMQGFIQRMLGS